MIWRWWYMYLPKSVQWSSVLIWVHLPSPWLPLPIRPRRWPICRLRIPGRQDWTCSARWWRSAGRTATTVSSTTGRVTVRWRTWWDWSRETHTSEGHACTPGPPATSWTPPGCDSASEPRPCVPTPLDRRSCRPPCWPNCLNFTRLSVEARTFVS